MSQTTITTSQYVSLRYNAAGVGSRISGRLLDWLIIAVYEAAMYSLLTTVLDNTSFSGSFEVILAVIFIAPALLYTLVFEYLLNGQTPGKMVTHTRVVQVDGSTPTLSSYLLRWMFELVDINLLGLGLFPILLSKRHQRFGDLAAGTMVINTIVAHLPLDERDFNYAYPGYVPTYPEAANLSQNQADLISRVVYYPGEERQAYEETLAAKIEQLLGIGRGTMDAERFLHTVSCDYHYYASTIEV